MQWAVMRPMLKLKSWKPSGSRSTITSGACASYGGWQSRPPGGGAAPTAIVVRTVYKFTPVTPLIAQFGSNGSFYLQEESYGLELY